MSGNRPVRLGERVNWIERSTKGKKEVSGRVIGIRLSAGIMLTDGGEFKGVQFQIEDDHGKKHWSSTFADREHHYTLKSGESE